MLQLGKTLLVGGAGFIGSHLLDAIVGQSDDITIVDDMSTGKQQNIEYHLNNITFIKSDICKFKTKNKYDTVFVLATGTKVTSAGINLVTASGIIYFVSSYTIYGHGDVLLQETSDTNTDTIDGKDKLKCEELIKKHTDRYFILRPGNIFGERQRPESEDGIVAIMKDALLFPKVIKLYNKGKSIRDFVYIDDVINAICSLQQFGIYNIGTTIGHRIIDLVNRVGVSYQDAGNKTEATRIVLNTEKLQKTGWQPKLDVLQYLDELKKQYSFFWETN